MDSALQERSERRSPSRSPLGTRTNPSLRGLVLAVAQARTLVLGGYSMQLRDRTAKPEAEVSHGFARDSRDTLKDNWQYVGMQLRLSGRGIGFQPVTQSDRLEAYPTPMFSARKIAPVNNKRLARDVAAGLTCQQQGRSDEFLRLAPAAQRGAVAEHLFLGVREQPSGQVGEERARSDAVDRDAKGSQVQGAGPRHGDEGRLGGRVDVAA